MLVNQVTQRSGQRRNSISQASGLGEPAGRAKTRPSLEYGLRRALSASHGLVLHHVGRAVWTHDPAPHFTGMQQPFLGSMQRRPMACPPGPALVCLQPSTRPEKKKGPALLVAERDRVSRLLPLLGGTRSRKPPKFPKWLLTCGAQVSSSLPQPPTEGAEGSVNWCLVEWHAAHCTLVVVLLLLLEEALLGVWTATCHFGRRTVRV